MLAIEAARTDLRENPSAGQKAFKMRLNHPLKLMQTPSFGSGKGRTVKFRFKEVDHERIN